MERFAVTSEGRPLIELERLAKEHGATDIKYAPLLGQLFCTLDREAAIRLDDLPGLTVRPIKKVSTKFTDALQIATPELVIPRNGVAEALATYSALVGSTASFWYEVLTSFTPPITGAGGTCAILDSGIRKTHRGLQGKVVYEKNFSDSPTLDDVYNHGTGVAYALCGGQLGEHQDQGIAPGVKIMNIKVLDDEGESSEENVIFGLEEVVRLTNAARDANLDPLDPMVITGVNLSFGEPDDGDPDNPLRVACRRTIAAYEDWTGWRLPIVAAAGNNGPEEGTIVCPACDPEVWAVGALDVRPFGISSYSSRGPSLEGIIKPDVVYYGTNITLASSIDDDSYIVKSGTSFAAPFAAGSGFVLWEILRRIAPEAGEQLTGDEFLYWINQTAVKPEGVAIAKDNIYGHGMPSGGVLAQMLTGVNVPAYIASGVVDMVMPIMVIGMIGMLGSSMTRSMNK